MTMPPLLNAPLPVYRGDAWSRTLHFWQDSGMTTPLNLTTQFGTAFAAQIRTSADTASDIVFNVDATAAATGTLVLSLTGVQTTDMSAASYYFDIQATGGTLDPVTILRGQIAITKDITR